MFFLLGLSILLAALLAFNSIASLLASLLWRLLGAPAESLSAASRATIIFLLRTFPFATSLACVALLLAPAYVELEPRSSNERVSTKLAIIAFASAVGLAFAGWRGIASWYKTVRLTSDWLRHAERIELPHVSIPAYRMPHQFPVIAIVGVFRPRLFVADRILSSLSETELLATMEHEAGHIVSHDNLRRGLMRACHDVLVMIPCGRLLDRAWNEASEAAADEYAAGRGGRIALDLASALVKIARLVPTGVTPAMPAGVFLVGADEVGGVKDRVRRLMQLADDSREERRTSVISRIPSWTPIALTVLIVVIASNEPHVLSSVHALIEASVYLLS